MTDDITITVHGKFADRPADETLDTAEYAVVQLGWAISNVAEWARRDRKAVLREDGELIDAERRLYALLQELGLTLARAA